MSKVPKSPANAAHSPPLAAAIARSPDVATASAAKSFVSPAPSAEPKVVLLSDWWLIKVETSSGEERLGISGLTSMGHHAARLFRSSPITKRYNAYTLGTADEIIVRIQGIVNKVHMLQNGFPLEACRYFMTGFPYNWDSYADEFFSGNYLPKDSRAEKYESSTANSDEYLPFGKIANLLKSLFTRVNDLRERDSIVVHDARSDAAHATDVRLGKPDLYDKETLRKDLNQCETTTSSPRLLQLKDGNTFEGLASCDVGRVDSCVAKGANLTKEPSIDEAVPGMDTIPSENTFRNIGVAEVVGTTLVLSTSGFHDRMLPISSTSEKLGNPISSIEGVATSEDLSYKSSGVVMQSMFKRKDSTAESQVQETGIFRDSHAETHHIREPANFPTVAGAGEGTNVDPKWQKQENLSTKTPICRRTLASCSNNVNKATIEPGGIICFEPPYQRSSGTGKQFSAYNINDVCHSKLQYTDNSLVTAEKRTESIGSGMDIRSNGVLVGESKGEKADKNSSLLSHPSGKDGVNVLEKNFGTRNSLQVAPESFMREEGGRPQTCSTALAGTHHFDFTIEGCESRPPTTANNAYDAGHTLEFSGKQEKEFATGVSTSFGVTTRSSSMKLAKPSHEGNSVTTRKVILGLAAVLEGQSDLNIVTKVKNKERQKKHKKTVAIQFKKHTPTSARKEPNVLKQPLNKFSDAEPTSSEGVPLVDQNGSFEGSVEHATTPGVSIRVDSSKDVNSQTNRKKTIVTPRTNKRSTSRSKLHRNTAKSTPVKNIRSSSYKNLHDSPHTWDKGNRLPIASPELLHLKRSRSGRLLVPALNKGSQHLVYDMDGSITGIAGVDILKSPGIARQGVLKSTNPGTKSETSKRKR